MAFNTFDREVINPLEKGLSSDIDMGSSYYDQEIRNLLAQFCQLRDPTLSTGAGLGSYTGFVANGFRVRPTSPASMDVTISPGFGFFYTTTDNTAAVGGIQGVFDQSDLKPMVLGAAQTLSVPANASGNPRIDIIQVKYNRQLTDPTNRLVWDNGTQQFVTGLVNKTLSWTLDGQTSYYPGTTAIVYKQGTPAGSPVAPSVDAGYVGIAQIYVAHGATSIAADRIADYRPLWFADGTFSVSIVMNGNVGAGATVLAPAGVSVAVDYNLSPTLRQIFVCAGDCNYTATVSFQPYNEIVTATSFPIVHNLTGGAGGSALSAGTIADLYNAAKTTPIATDMAIGQQAIGIDFTTSILNVTAPSVTNSDSFAVEATIIFRRIP